MLLTIAYASVQMIAIFMCASSAHAHMQGQKLAIESAEYTNNVYLQSMYVHCQHMLVRLAIGTGIYFLRLIYTGVLKEAHKLMLGMLEQQTRRMHILR